MADSERESGMGSDGLRGNRNSSCGILCRSNGVLQNDHASEATGMHSFRCDIPFLVDVNYGAAVWRTTGFDLDYGTFGCRGDGNSCTCSLR